MPLKVLIISGLLPVMGGLFWYLGVSQKKAEENEGVGYVDPELASFYDKSRIFGRALFYVGISVLLYQGVTYFIGF